MLLVCFCLVDFNFKIYLSSITAKPLRGHRLHDVLYIYRVEDGEEDTENVDEDDDDEDDDDDDDVVVEEEEENVVEGESECEKEGEADEEIGEEIEEEQEPSEERLVGIN